MIRPAIQQLPVGIEPGIDAAIARELALPIMERQVPAGVLVKTMMATPAAPQSPRQARLSICAECPNIRKAENALFDRCGVCGCILRALTFIPGRCSIQKW